MPFRNELVTLEAKGLEMLKLFIVKVFLSILVGTTFVVSTKYIDPWVLEFVV
jgi:hypothetical protein